MNICVITSDYLDTKRSEFYFFKNVVEQWGF